MIAYNTLVEIDGFKGRKAVLQSSPEQNRIDGLVAKCKAASAITTILAEQSDEDILTVLDRALSETCKALEAPVACLHLADRERGELNLVTGIKLDPVHGHAWQRLKIGGISLQAQVLDDGSVHEQITASASASGSSLVCSPVFGNREAIGVISLVWPKPYRLYPDQDRRVFLTTVGQLLGLALEHAGLVSELVENLNQLKELQTQEEERNRALAGLNLDLQKANRRLEELSVTDGLTGLHNRRYLIERLKREIARSQRLGHPVCLIMADLDHFKQVNDRLGHQAGDQALRLFAQLLSDGLRKVDTVGRYGGEEFCLVLVDCNLDFAVAVADKLRAQFEQKSRTSPFEGLGGLSVSMGVAQLEDGMDFEDFLELADKALYRAKQKGRNQVVFHNKDDVTH